MPIHPGGAAYVRQHPFLGAMGPGVSPHSDIVAPCLLHDGPEEIKRAWLPKMAAGATGKPLEKVGWKAQATAELFFDCVRVPVGNLPGGKGRGFVQRMQQLPRERLLQAVRAASTLQAALRWTEAHTVRRRAFGQSMAEAQNTRFKPAEVERKAALMRVFTGRCLQMHLKGALDAMDAAMAASGTIRLRPPGPHRGRRRRDHARGHRPRHPGQTAMIRFADQLRTMRRRPVAHVPGL